MRLIKMLEPVNGKQYALWECGRCNQPPRRLGYKVGRNMRACYQCQQRQRLQEVEEVFTPKNLDIEIRECLMCGIGFESFGVGNRRCPDCSGKFSCIETENNYMRAKSDDFMRLVGDRVGSEEDFIRRIIY